MFLHRDSYTDEALGLVVEKSCSNTIFDFLIMSWRFLGKNSVIWYLLQEKYRQCFEQLLLLVRLVAILYCTPVRFILDC